MYLCIDILFVKNGYIVLRFEHIREPCFNLTDVLVLYTIPILCIYVYNTICGTNRIHGHCICLLDESSNFCNKSLGGLTYNLIYNIIFLLRSKNIKGDYYV